MRVKISTSESPESRSPSRVFRKWVIIGAALGAVLSGLAAFMVVGVVMLGGALVGAVFGAVFGVFRALLAVVRRE